MNAGELRHRIDIDERVTAQDEHGDEIVTWSTWVTSEPAQVRPITGKEFVAGQGLVGQSTTRIKIRWRRGLVPTMRIRHLVEDGSPPIHDLYDIDRVLPDDKSGREYIVMECTKGVNEG